MVWCAPDLTPEVATEPRKKVTFSRPTTLVEKQKNQPTGTKNMNMHVQGSTEHSLSAQTHHNTSSNFRRNKSTRPHSKTTVIGASLKTRLHCNHLRPKCKCSNISSRKRPHKAKNTVPGNDSQRRVLSSSCYLPRGETNDRKIYQSIGESVSICDATWRPSQNSSSEGKSETKGENQKYKNEEKIIKKKLRFEDQMTERNESYSPDEVKDTAKEINSSKSQMQNEIRRLSSSHIPPTHSRASSRMDFESKNKKISADYCRLCEELERGKSSESYRKRKKAEVSIDHNENASKFYPNPDHFSFHDRNHEICFLCHRNTNHICINDDNYCTICDTHIYCSDEGMKEDSHSLHQRNSASRHGGGDYHKSLTRIPYEPRTKFVKNLKQKLETSYRGDELNRGTSRETCAETRGTEGSMGSRRQHAGQHHIHDGKKCLHRYQQNDRLFLEPTITDRKGDSICGECGAPQPSNPQKEPYLYHITLGGLKTNSGKDRIVLQETTPYRGKENSVSYHSKSRKKSNDISKLIYAKLNDSIDNIFGKGDLHFAFSKPSAPLDFPASLYSKRHPSRSMALIDHII